MGTYQNNKEKPAKSKKRKQSQGTWGGFIDCPMGKSEREDFTKHVKDSTIGVFDLMLSLLDEDVMLSMSWSSNDEAYLAKATQVNEEDGKRYMLTAFHGDVETAWELLFYKHVTLLGENWFPDLDASSEEDNWG
jgi:hypothetical protein